MRPTEFSHDRWSQVRLRRWTNLHARADADTTFEVILAEVHRERAKPPQPLWLGYRPGHTTYPLREVWSWYDFRWPIETLFSDLKGRGFHLDDTRLWQPDRLHRLLLAATMAYFLMLALGVEAIVSGVFRQLVRTDAFYHSLFQLGLFYLNHIFNEFLDFPSLTSLPPPHTFEHVVIS